MATIEARDLARLSPQQRAALETLLWQRRAPQPPVNAQEEGIVRRSREDGAAPLSFAQQRLWFIDQLEPGSPLYNMPMALRVEGALHPRVLRQTLGEIVRRHEALRTIFAAGEGGPVQIVQPAAPFELPLVDLSALPEGMREAAAFDLVAEEAGRPFDLARGPLLRGALLAMAGEEHIAVLTLHHIASDDWSLGILVREISALYMAFATGGPSPLPELPVQYADFAAWQRRALSGALLDRRVAFWRTALDGAPLVLELPADHPRPPVQSLRGASFAVHLPPAVEAGVRDLARRAGASPFMVLFAAFGTLLGRLAGQEDLLIGSPVAGRSRAEIEGLIGFFINPLALRVRPRAEVTFFDLVGEARDTVIDATAEQDMPFERLVEELSPERDPSRTPIFQTVLDFQTAPLGPLELPGIALHPFAGENRTAKNDLTLHLIERAPGSGWGGNFEYSTDLFEEPTIARWTGHLASLLAGALANPAQWVGELPLLTPGERGEVVAGWSRSLELRPAEPGTLAAIFEAAADQYPDLPALVSGDLEWTYAELEARANQLARHLRLFGAGPEVAVGVCCDASPELVVAALGIAKAGGVYVPLDPQLPLERLSYVIEDAGLAIILTQEHLQDALPALPVFVIVIDGAGWDLIAIEPMERLTDGTGSPDNLAYVIYTSGSTGRPKGVGVTHRGLATLGSELARLAAIEPGDRVLLFASIGFDASVSEFVQAWAAGAALVLASREERMPGPALARLLTEHRVSVVTLPPSALAVLPELPPGVPACLIIAGEACPPDLAARWQPGRRFVDAYGPTETTVCASALIYEGGRLTIGRPIAGFELFVADRTGQLQPPGVPGELLLGGPALARGYIGRPDLTAERFVPHSEGVRLYRTGDLARTVVVERNGQASREIELRGRIDHQVKIRGFRIELGEIETVLASQAGVREAAVVVREDTPGDPRLVAYLIGDSQAEELRQALRERLPEYMVPSAFVTLAALPLTPNGKVDRKALPAPDRQSDSDDYLTPRTPVEEILAGIWAGLLGIERAGIDAHFFDLGGHSLLATQMISHLRDAFGVEIPLRVLFDAPILADLAARIEEERRAGTGQLAPPLVPRLEEGPPPLSFAQQRLWFIDQLEPGSPAYNLPVTLRITGPLDSQVLALCLGEIARRHESLRTIFAAQDGSPVQVVRPVAPFALSLVDLSEHPDLALRLAGEEAVRPFDLEQGPLLRGVLLRLDRDEHVIALTLHHIVSDGWSMGILVREVTALYQAFAAGRPSPLPELPLQYADFAAWQHSWLHGEVLEEEISFWRGQLAGLPPLLDLPTDRPRPAEQSYRGAVRPVLLPAELSRQAADLARREGATLFMVLLAAFQALLARISGQDDLAVGSPVAGRNRTETEGLIGFFVNTLVLRGDVGRGSFRELLGRSRETLLEVWRHQDVPFEKLVQELAPERSLAHTPLFQVMLALQNTPAAELNVAGLGFSQVATEATTSKFDLTLTLSETLAGGLEYAADLFDPSTIDRFLGHLAQLLSGATADPETPVSALRLMDAAEERELLLHSRDGSGRTWALPATVHDLYLQRAERTPDRIAAIGSQGVLTHGEIAERSAGLARRIRNVLPYPLDRPVALFAEADAPVLAGMLGILQAGAGFVPLDPRYPDERLSWVVQDAACDVLVTPRRHLERAAALGVRHVLCLEENLCIESTVEKDEPAALAYIVYTSGSTGRPKGVQISHENLVPILLWGIDHLGLGVSSRVLQSLSICFDFGIFEHLTTLLAGGTLVFPGEAAAGDPFASAREIVREGIDTLHTTPALAREIAAAGADLGGLTVLHLGGEALPPETVSRLRETAPRAAIYNGYGPTEASVNCAIFRISEDAPRFTVPIGRPSADNALYILDRAGLPVPFGVRGDLHVGGIGVARGYLNRPDLTAERFVPDPFGSFPGGRLYRTGDLVRYRPSGDIEFLGRLDLQVKIRGFRIELEEIETALLALPGVHEAVVMARSGRLVAYLVGDVSTDTVRDSLRERLPDYMVPSAFVVLDALPLTPNGKVDRKALPEPEQPTSCEGYRAPRTRAEEILAAVWAQVLRLPRVGVEDNFFELGGDSILSIQIVARARQAGLLFTVRQVFEHQTVAGLARHATPADAATASQAEQGPVSGEVPLTPIQRWFFAQGFADSHHFNQALVLESGEPLSPSALERAAAAVVEHHDALRLRFHPVTDGWRQENAPAEPVTPFSQVELSGLPEARRPESFERAAADLQGGFDLSAGPLTRLCLFNAGERQPQRLLWVAHHLVVDGVSWRILVEDLETAYRQGALPPKTTSFQEWAHRLTAPAIPSAAPSADNLVRDEATVSFELDAEETTGLLQTLPSVYHSRIDEALLSALARALAVWDGSSRLQVDLERHGRDQLLDDLDVSRTVGWFTTLSPVAQEVGDAGPGDALVSMKERLRSPRPIESGAPPSEISFNYLGQIDASFDERSLFRMSGFGAGPTRSPRAHRAHALEVSGLVAGGRLRISLTYGSRMHGRESAQALASAYAGALRELVRHGRESAEMVLRDAADAYPLTPLQSGMLFHSLMEPGSGVYVNQLTCSLAEDLDPRLFRQVWERLAARHDALRTAFLWERLGEPLQIVRRHVDLPWQDLDWRDLPAEERLSRFEELRLRERHSPLPLDRAPLMRFSLVRLDRGYGFIWTSHHLLMDGWSIPLLVQELGTVYAALKEGREAALPAVPPFGKYIAWLQKQDTAQAEPFWRQELSGFTHPNSLGLVSPDGAIGDGGDGELTIRVSREVTETLQALASRNKMTLQTVVLGAWALLVSRYGGEEDVVFGNVVSGRPADLPGVETMIGLFINTLPVRTRVDGAELLTLWLQRLQERQLARRDFEHTPLAQIQRWSEVPPGSPLFDTLFVFENYPAPQEGAGSGGLGIGELRSLESTNYPYTLVAAAADQISLRLMYDRARLGENAAPRLLGHLATLLGGMAARPESVLDDLSLFSVEEARQLRSGGEEAYPLDRPLHVRVEEQVERSPDAVAVTFETEALTYGELDRRSNRLARYLTGLGVGPETRVAVQMERSTELIVALLAILKAGGAYVPLDLAYPAERIAFLLEDSAATVLLTGARLDADRKRIEALSDARLPIAADPAHLAYVIYTSGSTGRPKGVQVTHANVLRLFAATQERFAFGPADVWTFFHSVAFDFSVWEIWGALVHGGRLAVVPFPVSRSPEQFLDLLVRERVTVLNQTPSAFAQLAQEDENRGGAATDLRLVVFGGEALDLPGLAPWFVRHGDGKPLLVNMYGITETTVHVTLRPLRVEDSRQRSSLIGLPVSDLSLTLVDRGLRPVPRGVPGEIAVGGAGLARGYLGRPELTAERFVPDPLGDEPGARLYRSGDLGRLVAQGDVDYLGRIDHQVKIRGFRIELGEIEAALTAHPQVRDTVVVARDGRLIAYLMVGGKAPSVEELQKSLGARLPDYMVPAAFVTLESFPLTPHGKVDRKALPEPGSDRPDFEQAFVAPATPEEAAWAEIWSGVLGVDRVGVHDNFFALGGDSIHILRVLARARERGLAATLQQIYQRQTIRGLLEEQGSTTPIEPVAEIPPFGLLAPGVRDHLPDGIEDAYPLAQLQTGMVFHSEYSPETAVFHDVFTYHVRSPLDLEALHGAVRELARRHAVLRTSFHLTGPGEPLQLVHREVEIPLGSTDLRPLSPTEQRAAIADWIEEERRQGFDWSSPPLVRFHVHRRGDDSFQIALSFHHALLDGWSIASFFSELFQEYFSRIGKRSDPRQPVHSTFRDFVALEREALASAEQREHWRRDLEGRTATLLPRWPRAEKGVRQVRRHPVPLSVETAEGVTRLASSLGVPVKSALLAAHLRVLQLLTGQVDLITGMVSNGRAEEEDGARVLGLFLNTVPFRLELRGGTWRELVRQVFAAERERLPFRRFPLAEIQRMLGGQPLFEAVFNFVSFHVYANTAGLMDLEVLDAEVVEETNFPLGVSFNLDPGSSRLQLTLDWDTSELQPGQVEALAGYYGRTLAAMATMPEERYEDAALLAPEETQLLVVEANDTRADGRTSLCVHHLFEEQAARSPGSTALILGDERLTYGELNAWANHLAARLRGLGVGPEVGLETTVGLCVERSFEAIAGILGVLKAGGAYLPLDPGYPPERLSFLLEDARVPVLLCQERLLARLPAHGAQVVLLDGTKPGDLSASENVRGGATPLHPAYVIHTSGSTGVPKGVAALHGGLANFALAMVEEIGLGPSHRFLEFASLSFDASAVQIFPTLVSGAALVLHPDPTGLSSHEILHLCERHGVTVLDLPAALWRQFMEDVAADGFGGAPLSVFMTGGESVAVARLRSWASTARPGSLFISSYGPTEATVTTTLFAVTREQVDGLDGRVIPLGRRLPNVQVHLLDRHVQPVPTAVPGEICIGGAGITRGYLGRPDLTAEAFTPDPFSEETGARLYRTGDMARRLPDGRLEFLGRFDHQVKVRGFRVEPGEIESVLATFPEVAHAAVMIREDSPGDVRLAAYIVPQPESGFDLRSLRGALQEKLPPHMVPAAFVVLDALPVTAHGKLDRQALPAPDGPGPDGSRPYREPRTPVERKLAEIWSEALRVERPGLDDSFFELGGHSLVAVQMAGRLREVFRIDFSLRTLYEAATLAELAAVIESNIERQTEGAERIAPPAPPPPLVPDPAGRFLPFPLMPVQQAYWIGQSELFELGGGGSNIYNEVEITGDLRGLLARLKMALPRWIERNDCLRTIVLSDGNQQVLERLPRYEPEIVDLRGLDTREVRDRLEVTRERLRSDRLTAGKWPPFEIVLFQLDGSRLRICARISALVLDGTGRGLVMEDLYRLVGDSNAPLAPTEVSFRDYALAREALRDTEAGRRSRDFWLRRLPGLPPAPELPRVGEGRLAVRSRFVFRQLELLDAETWTRLRSRAARADLTPTGAVLAAFVDVLTAFSGSVRFTLGLVGTEHLPLHPKAGEIVGNFNTIHLLEVDGWDGPFETRARRLRDRLASDQEHPYVSGMEVLRELNRLHGNRYGATLPVLFNSVIEYSEARGESSPDGGSSEAAHNDDFRTVELNIYTPQVLLSPTVMESPDGRLLCKWQAVDDAFPPGLISAMAAAFESRLIELAGREESWQAAPMPPPENPADAGRLDPRDAEEEEVAELWRGVLGTGDFGIRDDFFAAGGDSFGVIRLVSALEDRILERGQPETPPRPGFWRRLKDRFARQPAPDTSQDVARSLFRERLMAAFVQGPTVENLAAFLRRERTARAAEIAELTPPASTAAQISMRRYMLLWFSQFVSGIGTGIGSFALGVWIYRQNASVTQYSLFAFVATVTALLVAPLAGVLADRWDRKRLILFGDSGAAVMTGLLALALYTNQLQLWHVYFIAVFMVGFSALQGPALLAATSMLVPRDQLGRVSGLAQAAGITTGLICPPLSGALVPILGYHGVIAIDIATFLFAFTVLLFIPLPSPPKSAAGPERRSFFADFAFGWTYLRKRPGLLQLLWVFAATNFALSIVQVLLTPLVLSFGSASNLGFVNMATAAGGLLGSVVLTIWGGPKNRISGILLFLLLQAPVLLLGALQPNVMLIAAASFAYTALSPIIGGLSQTIWQTKVAHDVQGRVFAMRGILVSATAPIAFLLAGPLADRVFEPLMAPGGALADTVGQLIGVGKGRGVGLLFITLGLFTMLVVLLFSRSRRLRKVETEVPDA